MNIDEIRARTARQMQEMQKRAQEAADRISAPDADDISAQEEEKKRAEEAERARKAAEQEEANLQRQREVLAQMMGARVRPAVRRHAGAGIGRDQAAGGSGGGTGAARRARGRYTAATSLHTFRRPPNPGDGRRGGRRRRGGVDARAAVRLCRREDAGNRRPRRAAAPPHTAPLPSRWEKFCILLSGIISTVNEHSLDGLNVEEHIPLYEQQIANLLRNSWGICGREELLDTLLYLSRGGYRARFAAYAEAASAEELFDEDTDEEDKEGIERGLAFVQHFKDKYEPEFLLGWDIGARR